MILTEGFGCYTVYYILIPPCSYGTLAMIDWVPAATSVYNLKCWNFCLLLRFYNCISK